MQTDYQKLKNKTTESLGLIIIFDIIFLVIAIIHFMKQDDFILNIIPYVFAFIFIILIFVVLNVFLTRNFKIMLDLIANSEQTPLIISSLTNDDMNILNITTIYQDQTRNIKFNEMIYMRDEDIEKFMELLHEKKINAINSWVHFGNPKFFEYNLKTLFEVLEFEPLYVKLLAKGHIEIKK